jgi:hypothetical protein
MPRKKVGAPSKSSYWRALYKENAHLFKKGDNTPLVSRWEADHPGQRMNASDKQAMANVKSMLKKKARKGGRPKMSDAVAAKPVGAAATHAALERLEIAVDDCLSTARRLDPTNLERAIKHLRAARNEIVWRSGEP